MLLCDINCDMGEGMDNDAAIMPYITAANIACGYHAGDETTMQQTVLLAKKFSVAVGAHPSYADRENFGRKEMQLTPEEVYHLVKTQIEILQKIAATKGMRLGHVKPHGALYNTAAKDPSLAAAIAKAVKDVDGNLVLYGLSSSHLISEGKSAGLVTKNEVFADRTYTEDGSLTPRTALNALIENESLVIQQVLQMVQQQKVTATTGKQLPIVAETICLHGDGANAVALAKRLHDALTIVK